MLVNIWIIQSVMSAVLQTTDAETWVTPDGKIVNFTPYFMGTSSY